MAPEISHDAAEQILRSQAARTDENFVGAMHVSPQLALLQGHANVFFCKHCGAGNAGGTLRLLKSRCDGTGESRRKARRKLERGLITRKLRPMRGAHFNCCAFFHDAAECLDSPRIVHLTSHQKSALSIDTRQR